MVKEFYTRFDQLYQHTTFSTAILYTFCPKNNEIFQIKHITSNLFFNIYFITFKVLLIGSNTHVPTFLPFFECPLECTLWYSL